MNLYKEHFHFGIDFNVGFTSPLKEIKLYGSSSTIGIPNSEDSSKIFYVSLMKAQSPSDSDNLDSKTPYECDAFVQID